MYDDDDDEDTDRLGVSHHLSPIQTDKTWVTELKQFNDGTNVGGF